MTATLSDFIIEEGDSVTNALEKIDRNKKRFLIVVDKDEKFLGTLTDGDVRRALLSREGAGKALVKEAYQTKSTSIGSDANDQELIQLFQSEKIGFLPVVDGNGKVINVITKRQFHIMLTSDKKINLEDRDILNIDEGVLESNILSRPWGVYKTLFKSDQTHVKTLMVKPEEQTSLQSHEKREEYWVVVKGKGELNIEDSKKIINPGDYVFIPKGTKHRITNTSKDELLTVIEIQLGDYFGEDDIKRYEDKYNRK
jgi:mannose-1-phosphate guanylyltransferase/mannose-6-phosphate isomerase